MKKKRILVDMSATIIHHGHIRLLKKASKYGKVIVALTRDIEVKKKSFNDEVEKELLAIENEILDLKKNSITSIKKIAIDISAEVIKKIMNSEINKSNVSAVVDDMIKRKVQKHT